MKTHVIVKTVLLLLVISVAAAPGIVLAKAPPGADLVDIAYSETQGIAVLSKYELFLSRDGREWTPAGFTDRAVELTAVGVGKELIIVASENGTLFRSVQDGPYQAVKPPRDPYGRTVKGVRTIAIHPKGTEVLASSGQGVIRSRDKGATWEAIADPFWKNPDAREILTVGYVKNDPVIVTRRGVYRQDEETFEPITGGLPETIRPTAASVFEGQVLMAVPGDGIYVAKKDSKFNKLKGAPGDPIAFVGFADDAYLAARPTTVVNRGDLKGNTWSPVGQYSGSFIPMDSVSTSFGDFLLLRGKGLVRLDGEKYVPVELPMDLSMVNAELVRQGNQIAGTQGGVYFSSSAGKQWQDVTPEGLGVAVNVFLPLEDGRILLGSDGAGVFVSDDAGASWRDWSLKLGTSNTIKALFPFGGGILAATENGLMWTRLGMEPDWQRRDGGIGRNSVLSMVKEGDSFWLATQSGVFRARDGEDFTRLTGIDGRVNSISVEKGKLAAVVSCRIVVADKNNKVTELKSFDRCTASAVSLFRGEIYTGTDDGLFKWGDGNWQKVDQRNHPVVGLYKDTGRLRVVTRGAGTYVYP